MAIGTRIGKYQRYLRLGLRLVFASGAERALARQIAESPYFDRDWYLSSNPRLPRLCRIWPERHYLLVGEKAGICPGPRFSPRVWRQARPDLAPEASELGDYLASGACARGISAEDRPAGANAPAMPAISRPAPGAPQAVVLHLYYREMWPEFAARLAQQTLPFDLFVTLPARAQHDDTALIAAIRADVPTARILAYPNHGRDIWPFLHLAQSGALSPYRAVCKLHSKKSPHRPDGETWRQSLIEGVLSQDPALTERRLAAFLADPRAGFWAADGEVLEGAGWWGSNRDKTQALAARLGLPPSADLRFAAGSIYWVSQALLARLSALPLDAGAFELECGQVDGTTAHALERLFGLIAQAEGFNILETFNLSQQRNVS